MYNSDESKQECSNDEPWIMTVKGLHVNSEPIKNVSSGIHLNRFEEHDGIKMDKYMSHNVGTLKSHSNKHHSHQHQNQQQHQLHSTTSATNNVLPPASHKRENSSNTSLNKTSISNTSITANNSSSMAASNSVSLTANYDQKQSMVQQHSQHQHSHFNEMNNSGGISDEMLSSSSSSSSSISASVAAVAATTSKVQQSITVQSSTNNLISKEQQQQHHHQQQQHHSISSISSPSSSSNSHKMNLRPTRSMSLDVDITRHSSVIIIN